MKDDLDRLLEGLGSVEAPAGFEGRILARLDGTREPRRHTGWGWAAATATVLLAAAGAYTWQKPSVHPDHRVEVKHEAHVQTISRTVLPEVIHRVSHNHDAAGLRRVMAGERGVEMECGFPAPEAPLNEQERLLLRLAQRPTPATLAMFDDRIRMQRTDAEMAELDLLNPVQPLVGPKTDTTELKEIHDDDIYAKR